MKKQTPTFSQLSYIVTGILAAHVQRGDELSQSVIEKAVFAAKTASDAITDIVNEGSDETADYPNPFAEYPWSDKPERYTDLANFLKQQGVSSNRRIGQIFRESLEAGWIEKEPLSGKYVKGQS